MVPTHDTIGELSARLVSPDEECRRTAVMELACRPLSETRSAIFQALGDASWRVRKEAVDALLAGEIDDGTIEELIDLLRSPDNAGLRNSTVEALERLGKKGVGCLARRISDDDHDVRKFVIDILGSIGDVTTVPLLVGALDDTDPNVSAAAAENLGKLGDPRAVEPLVSTLAKNDVWLSYTILEALSRIGRPVPMAVIAPLAAVNLLKKAVYECLGAIGGVEAIPLLVDGLKERVKNARETAALALVKVRERLSETGNAGEIDTRLAELNGSPFVDALIASLDGCDRPVREALIRIIGLIGDERGVGRLLQGCRDERLRRFCLQAFASMGGNGTRALLGAYRTADEDERSLIAYICGELRFQGCGEILREGMRGHNPVLRRASVLACGKIGLAVRIGDIVQLLDDPEAEVREGAIEALARLAAHDGVAVLGVAQQLEISGEPAKRRDAVSLYAALCEGDRLALLMKDEDAAVRRAAVAALAGLRLSTSINPLVMALVDEDVDVRIAAAGALGEIGGAATVDPLLLTLRDDDPWVKCAVLKSLAKIDPPAALAAICRIIPESEGLVLICAIEALAGIGGEEALVQVQKTLDNSDEEVVKTALGILASGDDGWIDLYRDRLLAHPHWDVRSSFVRIMAEKLGKDALPSLRSALETESDELVRGEIRAVMDRFQ